MLDKPGGIIRRTRLANAGTRRYNAVKGRIKVTAVPPLKATMRTKELCGELFNILVLPPYEILWRKQDVKTSTTLLTPPKQKTLTT
jgi:hypothetical protein